MIPGKNFGGMTLEEIKAMLTDHDYEDQKSGHTDAGQYNPDTGETRYLHIK